MDIFIPDNVIFSSRFDIQLDDCISRDFEKENVNLVCGQVDMDWGYIFEGRSLVFVDQDEEDLLHDEFVVYYPIQFSESGLSDQSKKEVASVLAFCGILSKA